MIPVRHITVANRSSYHRAGFEMNSNSVCSSQSVYRWPITRLSLDRPAMWFLFVCCFAVVYAVFAF